MRNMSRRVSLLHITFDSVVNFQIYTLLSTRVRAEHDMIKYLKKSRKKECRNRKLFWDIVFGELGSR